jgi:hypothetical protein
MAERTEYTAADPIQDFQARALKLATMFKALARLAGADSYTGMETDHEIRLVAKQGERMAQELSDDIDQFSIESHQRSPEVVHD